MSYATFITTIKEITYNQRDKKIFEATEEYYDFISKKAIEFCYQISNNQPYHPFYVPHKRIYPSMAKIIQDEKNIFLDLINSINENYQITKLLFMFFGNEKIVTEVIKTSFDDLIANIKNDNVEFYKIYKLKRSYQDFTN